MGTYMQVEKQVVRRHKLKGKDYRANIHQLEAAGDEYEQALAHRKIAQRLKSVKEIQAAVLRGDKPEVEFQVAPELSKDLTLKLYKWILIAHLYLYYMTIQTFIATTEDGDLAEIPALLNALEPKKAERRYSRLLRNRNELLRRLHVTRKPGEDYRIVLQKAYYTYRTKDKLFGDNITTWIQNYAKLQELVYSRTVIPEFTKDPQDMSESEVAALQALIFEKYCNVQVSPTSLPCRLDCLCFERRRGPSSLSET
jgi:hypothetical protein